MLDFERPLLMGVVNVTPDSFSDGGLFLQRAAAIAHAQRLIDEGADILDVGGESTRPGAAGVSEAEEIDRVVPVLETLRATGVVLSVDTSKPAVMRAALAAGAAIVNDVRALNEPGAVETVAKSDCGIVIMHMQGTPRTMQHNPRYADVVIDVCNFLHERIIALAAQGIDAMRVAVDPGFGFGKSVEHNFQLLGRLSELTVVRRPILAGLSRKSMLGAVTGRPIGERTAASVAAALIAVERGARIVRAHEVAATRDALRVWSATRKGEQ
ncbi:MAG TPA: dihydropteroate synthase [Burkholderiaceae bacterium]|nr:dihydropteroate synthase [Burkholderiaceae bacterium]